MGVLGVKTDGVPKTSFRGAVGSLRLFCCLHLYLVNFLYLTIETVKDMKKLSFFLC